MSWDDPHRLGYRRVDGDPNVAVLIETMDATARWNATRDLRRWERRHLGLRPGLRLLDVGCGLGDAALALAADLGDNGEVVGIDVSETMLAVARERALGAGCSVRFSVGDALALGEPDASFDVVRSERTLQWLSDPAAAVTEMARVVRPGGRLALIDTDWSTLQIEVGDDGIATAVREAMRSERARPSNVGARLDELVRSAGFGEITTTSATEIWTQWDPDAAPAPAGCFSMASLAEDLVSAGQLDPTAADRFVATIHDASRSGRFSMRLTMFGVVASRQRRPAPQ